MRQVDHLVAGQLAPAVGGDLAVLGIQADDDVAAERGAGVLQEAGVLDGGRADDHVAQAGVDVAFDGVQVADAAAQLHRDLVAHLAQDRWMASSFLGLPAKAPFRSTRCRRRAPLSTQLRAICGGVFTEGGGLVHVALFEAHTVAVFEVNRGNQIA